MCILGSLHMLGIVQGVGELRVASFLNDVLRSNVKYAVKGCQDVRPKPKVLSAFVGL